MTSAMSGPMAAPAHDLPAATAPTATAAQAVAADAATANAPAEPKKKRDGFLDTVRTIALVRVIIWHAFGVPWISWVVATMPTMFFVAGSLLASTLDRKPVPVMYRARLKRLLVPYWFFAAIVLTFLSLVHLAGPGPNTALGVGQLLPWIIPFTDPTGSIWEAGWASSPLWYLRAYLWLLLLSPLLRAGVRRFGAMSLLPSFFATAAIEWWLHNPQALGTTPGNWTWMMGELTLYSFFLMLGFLHYDGAFDKLTRAGMREWLLIGVVGCAIWWLEFPAPTGVINHSFVGLLAIGISWLAFFLMLRPMLSTWTENGITGPFIYLFNRRAMTVYLWHSPCIVAGYQILEIFAPEANVVAVMIPAMALLVVAIATTGWIEDVAGGNRAEVWPRKGNATYWRNPWAQAEHSGPSMWRRHGVGLAMGMAGALVAAGLIVSPTSGANVTTAAAGNADLPPAPSGRPSVADFGDSDNDESSEGADLPPAPSGRPSVADFGNDTSAEDSTASADADLPPAPSARPSVADFGEADSATTGAAPASGENTPSTGDPLMDTLQGWLNTYDVSGARVAISKPDGTVVSLAAGSYGGEDILASDIVPLTSATKSMTAAIILALVDEGVLELDAKVPALTAVPSFTHDVTLRQLLDHTAGVAPYQEAPGYASGETLSPVAAVELSAAAPLQWTPGTERGYSNSGYLVLGLLAEQVTGQTFADLSAAYASALNLPTLTLDENMRQGWVGASAGGLVGTVSDLANWGAALYRDGKVLTPQALSNMTTLDPTFGIGLGAFPVCPCGTAEDGSRFYASIGHNGGEVTVQYSPADDLVIAVSLTESLWTPFLNEQDVAVLLAELRSAM